MATGGELTDVQIEMLVFLAGRCAVPPPGVGPRTSQSLLRRGLIEHVREDAGRLHATDSGRRVVAALSNLLPGVSDTYSVDRGSSSALSRRSQPE